METMQEKPESVYTAIEIEEGFYRIEEGGVRSFLVMGKEKAMLVDTGFGTGNIKEFAQSLTRLPIFVVNTHTDRDHTGCNNLFDQIYMHPSEYDYYFSKISNAPKLMPLWEGNVLDLDPYQFEVILIPGHTPGSIALFDRKRKLLISGDSIQAGAIFMFGRGRNMHSFIESMKKLNALSDQIENIYPSHGPLPVKPEMIGKLMKGAEMVLRGDVIGIKPERDLPCKLFSYGEAKFLYSDEQNNS